MAAGASATGLLKLILARTLSQKIIGDALVANVTHGTASRDTADVLIDHQPSFNSLSTALVIAARRRLLSHCQLFLAHGARLDFDSHAAVRIAVSQPDLLDVLLSGGPGHQALAAAFEEAALLLHPSKLEAMKSILQAGLQGHIVNDYLITLTSHEHDINLIQLLLEHGADPNHDDGAALCNACARGHSAGIATILLFRPSQQSRSRALHHLVKSDPEVMPTEQFCQAIDSLISNSPMPLRFAPFEPGPEATIHILLCKRNQDSVSVRKALEAGCSAAPKGRADETLSWAMAAIPRIKTECLGILIEHGANVMHVNLKGESLVMQAIQTGRSCLIKHLVQHGAHGSLRDKHGRSPLLLAVEKQDMKAIDGLLKAGVDRDDRSLHQAVYNLQPAIVSSTSTPAHKLILSRSRHCFITTMIPLCPHHCLLMRGGRH